MSRAAKRILVYLPLADKGLIVDLTNDLIIYNSTTNSFVLSYRIKFVLYFNCTSFAEILSFKEALLVQYPESI